MAHHSLIHETFKMSLDIQVFENDISFPTNTIMNIDVESCGFCGNTTMDIDVKELAKFGVQLSEIYISLKGKTKIQEPYGQKQFVEFIGDGVGHVSVCGMISNETTFSQKLCFENQIDQTILKDFANELKEKYSIYLR